MHIRTITGIAAIIATVVLLSSTPCLAACDLPDAGDGTVLLPPVGCAYITERELHMMIDGLPPETDIQVRAIHTGFQDILWNDDTRLGPLGEKEEFNSTLELEMTGTGALSAFSRTISVDVHCIAYTAAQVASGNFDTEMASLQGSISGDADFDVLQISAGADLGLGASTGLTSFQDVGGGLIRTRSCFNMNYEIYFEGAAGGDLAGLSGTTNGTARMCVDNPIPTVSEWGLVVMTLLVLAAGTVVLRRHRATVA